MNPELRTNVQNHIQEHIDMLRQVDPDLLMLIGQQPLQNLGAPQQPPGMQAPMPVQGGVIPPQMGAGMDGIMQPPNGMPQNPQDMIKGQGNLGGSNLPPLPTPPAPFENLPTQAQDILPQG